MPARLISMVRTRVTSGESVNDLKQPPQRVVCWERPPQVIVRKHEIQIGSLFLIKSINSILFVILTLTFQQLHAPFPCPSNARPEIGVFEWHRR